MNYILKILVLAAADAIFGLLFAALAWPLVHNAVPAASFLHLWMVGVGLRQLVSVSVASKE